MPVCRMISVVGVHCEGEACDVVVGGVADPVHCKTMYDKLKHFRDKADNTRLLLMQEPRGRSAQCMNMLLAPCDPRADIAFLTMESDEYPPMSGANTIATTTVILETGLIPMKEPVTELKLDTAAGLITVEADCEAGKCKSVSFSNVPCFVYALSHEVSVPGIGTIAVDVVWGGMFYVLVDVTSIGLSICHADAFQLVQLGEKIKTAVRESITPVHPENAEIQGVTVLEFTAPLRLVDGVKTADNTVVVSPGRLDRSPCGTGSCARLAVLHARGQLADGELLIHRSIIGSEFRCQIRGTTKVGQYDAVRPTVQGRAWLTGSRQVTLDSMDPWPEGFRVGDQWLNQSPLA